MNKAIFHHLYDDGQRYDQLFAPCIACVKKHLQPDGRFVVDVFIPKPELLLDKPGERFPCGEFEDPDGRKVAVTHSYVYERDTRIKRITTYPRVDDNEEVAGTLAMRRYYPRELDVLLECNGFSIEHKYGGYGRRLFDARAATQRVACGKK